MDSNIEELKLVLIKNNPILFLGAGFSLGSENSFGSVPTGKKLKSNITEKFLKHKLGDSDYKEVLNYTLDDVCQCVHSIYKGKEELNEYLIQIFKDLVPNANHYKITKYNWKKIYTINIDDLIEKVYKREGKKLLIQDNKNNKKNGEGIEYIKLHGSVNNFSEGFVFSKNEYNELLTPNYRLNDLVSDIFVDDFIFVGTSFDEQDIEYYLSQYKNAGYLSKRGKLFFINPTPDLKLRNKISEIGGILIEWNTYQFLDFIADLNYSPDAISKALKQLQYHGIYSINSIRDSFNKPDPYESRLYEGYDCLWQDVFEEWDFQTEYLEKALKIIDNFSNGINNITCLSIYGIAFSGKSSLLKQVGKEFMKKSYEILEYRGRTLDFDTLIDYIRICPSNKFILLIDNASFYYKMIEQLFTKNIQNKKLIIVTASRIYYHNKKRYYLEGNPFIELEVNSNITKEYAKFIYRTLKVKGYLADYNKMDYNAAIYKIQKEKELINFLTNLTYGTGFRKKIRYEVSEMDNTWEKQLLLEISVFNKADLAYYPNEMFIHRCAGNLKNVNNSKYIMNYVKRNEQGVSLKNNLFSEQLLHNVSKESVIKSITNILIYISSRVNEDNYNYWKIIFESLLKEDILEKIFKFSTNDIKKMFYTLKEYYKDVSYYWLQLGLTEQKDQDYTKALNHLLMAESIKPYAYQIQHAIARNYLKHANYEHNSTLAQKLFDEGEKGMLELINSKEYYKQKAKPYSIHCYLTEKIIYINKYKLPVSNNELRSMKSYIEFIAGREEVLAYELAKQFYELLMKRDKLNMIQITTDSIFYSVVFDNNKIEKNNELTDRLIDAV